MSEWKTEDLIAADKKFVWHPFTNMRDWCAPEHEPLVLVEGEGAILRDSRGREYIDGNSSIWTNIHGHNHPHINGAIRKQLGHELKQTDDVDLGAKVCVAARGRGLLTRPIRNVIVLMPPLCITSAQLSAAIAAIRDSIVDVCGVS
ncbi:MAG TPA: aminotransferase class III-fold pyridoxal phosphate-dependent enzyme [Chthoniobacterales bacterium]|nr:aminotransferase class III-fold pyridoxal phosphate-dependent enzyme [Chthoniobacterales bacterium]